MIEKDPEKCSQYIPKPYGFGIYQCSRKKTHGEYCWQHKKTKPRKPSPAQVNAALEENHRRMVESNGYGY